MFFRSLKVDRRQKMMQSYPVNLNAGACTWQGQVAWFVWFWSVQSLWFGPWLWVGQGSAIDSFSLNSSYFLAKGVPVLGALFNLGVAWHLWLRSTDIGEDQRIICITCQVRVLNMFEVKTTIICSTNIQSNSAWKWSASELGWYLCVLHCQDTEGFYSWEKCQESIGTWFKQPLICQGWDMILGRRCGSIFLTKRIPKGSIQSN